jgi:hypothetical protein
MFAITALLGVNANLTYATGETATETPNKRSDIFYLAPVSQYGNIPAAGSGTAQSQIATLIWGLVMNVRYIIGAVAIGMIVFAGFRMVTGWGKEEVYGEQRMGIFYVVLGLTAVGLAGELASVFSVACPPAVAGQPVAPCVTGGFLKDPNAIVRAATLFDQRTQIIITFIKYFVGGIAVMMIIRNGMRMISMGSSEDKIATDKKNLFYSIVGLIIITVSDLAINKVFYKIDRTR